ncbi:MAG: transporter ATP-binding protein [Symbiobacteriaceae bacterium]|jgi:ATP-binding cassette subfamily B protein|nr:transporter ATP-binding protein [Symbiobacteriaceae bacterium]
MQKSSPLKHLPWALRLTYRTAPVETVLIIAGLLINRIAPPAALLALQQMVNAVAEGAGASAITRPLIWLVLLVVLSELGGSISFFADNRLWDKIYVKVLDLLMQKASTLSLAQFEQPEIHDLIERTTQGDRGRVFRMVYVSIQSVAIAAGLLSALALLITASPWLAVAALAMAVPVSWVGVRQGARWFDLVRRQSPGRRFTQYLGGLLSRREAATELRAYQLVGYFLEKWRRSFARRRADHLDVRWANVKEGWLAAVCAAMLFAGALGGAIYLASSGRVGPGEIAVLIGAIRILQASLGHLAANVGAVWEMGLPVAELRSYLEMAVPAPHTGAGVAFPTPMQGVIRFEGVTFTYPGGGEPVLRNLTMEIRAGEKVALVGANGAGKSTLTKLLLGLYQPDAGRITIDGVPIGEILPDSFRQNVSCVFQDFVRYNLTLHDNVAVGNLEATPAQVEAACSAAGLERLPAGPETMLGRTFTGGVELSGGQWQRIAMARTFVRGAQLIVLDEPTAALDPRAEMEVFAKFVELVKGKTALLISHRLGSARMADRVIVLNDGRVAETGSHDELMAAGGLYAELFKTQAQWYEEAGGDVA